MIAQVNAGALCPLISADDWSVVDKMRSFFKSKGFQEVHVQNRLSILAACEDPWNIATFEYVGQVWPLQQTGQMWLEYELLNNPEAEGFFCVTTSYRNEPNADPERHCRIFPMFEFEMKGGIDDMIQLERELLSHLGFEVPNDGVNGYLGEGDYESVANSFGTDELTSDHENNLWELWGYDNFFLTYFPERTSPFWNMKRNEKDGNLSNKVDVIMMGQETIGSAERSCNPDEMRSTFYSIEDGKYAKRLFELFGKERVETELEEFLSHDFSPRSGGGIGITRLVRAMQIKGLL